MFTKKLFLAAPAAFLLIASFPAPARADTPAASSKEPPKTWIDPDTGHRIIRLTEQPGSDSFYFNINACTPDGREMAYSTPDGGIGVINLTTFESRTLIKGPIRGAVVGRKTPRVFYLKPNENALYSTNLDTGETQKLVDLPDHGTIGTVNADETLAAGTRVVGEGSERRFVTGDTRGLMQAVNKTDMMDKRLAEHYPMELYTVDLQTGKVNVILRGTDWYNHPEFSPTDPMLLMYCHEGPAWKVDRIWLIRTDGTQNRLIHQRTLGLEEVSHEFWSADGKAISYDLRLNQQTDFFVGSYNVESKERTWYHLDPSLWSIHYNQSPDGTLYCGDGCSPKRVVWTTAANEWLYLFRPELFKDTDTPGSGLIHPGIFHAERLVNMSRHNYFLEPNAFFTPDQKYIIFRSNMFGPDYPFAVEVAKATTP